MTRRLPFALALAAVAAIPLGTSDFVGFVFSLGLIYGLLALSLSMLTGWVGQASLGHAAFVGAGAFTAGLLQEQGWPFWALFPAAVAVATPVSLLVGIPALRIRGLQLAVATLAFGWTVERAVFGQVFSSYWSGLTVHRPEVAGISFRRDRQYYLIVLAVAVLLTVFAANLRRRSSGRAFSAVRESESVFSHVGGSVASYKLLAFWLSTVYAAIAGVLYGGLLGPLNSGLFNLQFSLYLLAMAIVGGMSSVIGPYIAGMAFAWYPQLLSGIEALQYWTYLIGGISIIVFVVALPGGLAALPHRLGLAGRRRSGGAIDTTEKATDELILADPSAEGVERRQRDLRHWARRGSRRPLLTVEDVTKRFGGTVALSGVNLGVRPGEVHGLVGPNGAGKSTLFDCITGVQRPQEGRIHYKGKDLLALPTHARARLGIARTFQNINLLQGLTVGENLLVAEQAHWSANFLLDGLGLDVGEKGPTVRRAAEENLEVLGLAVLRDVPVHDLPHGTMKLVELGRALTAEPELLLLDEPAAGLDAHEVEQFVQLLLRLRDERQVTVLLVEHDMALVMSICDSVTVLDYGKVLASGPPDQVRNDPAVISAYLGEPIEEAVDAPVG